MACIEGGPQEWAPKILVEQRAHNNANKSQPPRRQIHPPLRDKGGAMLAYSPWMVHFILEDHGTTRKGTEANIVHAVRHTHLQYHISVWNVVVTCGTAQSTTLFRLHPMMENTAYTIYMWSEYGTTTGMEWRPTPKWQVALHAQNTARQRTTGPPRPDSQGKTQLISITNSVSANAQMPLINTGHPAPDDTTHRRTWNTIPRALHHSIDRDHATWVVQGSIPFRVGGWLNTLHPL